MCITFFFVGNDSSKDKYKMILIMNRDEYFKRPTSRCEWQNGILAGRDQYPGKEGGTWLAMNSKGCIGALTNIYTGKSKPGEGRGFLVIDYLDESRENDPNAYLQELSQSKLTYSPFNIVMFRPKDNTYEGYYYCRGFKDCFISDSYGPEKIGPGFHGISNHPMKFPYKKTEAGVKMFQEIVETHVEDEKVLQEKLFEMMTDCTSYHPDEQMIKQGGNDSPISDYHNKLACVHVRIPEVGYGTRVTSLILIDYDNNATYIEKSHEPGQDEKKFQFKI